MVAGGSFAIARISAQLLSGRNCRTSSLHWKSLVCLTLFLKRWQPVRIFRFGDMGASQVDRDAGLRTAISTGQIVRARRRFCSRTATVHFLPSVPPFKALLAPGGALYDWVINVPVPYLDTNWSPVCRRWSRLRSDCHAAVYNDWFSATGTAILFAALLSIVWLKMKPPAAIQTFGSTLKELALPIYPSAWCWRSRLSRTIPGFFHAGAALAHTGSASRSFLAVPRLAASS